MLKRWMLICCIVAALGATVPAIAAPNILFFYGDDWGRYASVYADPDRPSVNDVIKTPNFDRIAREGVLFTNAFYPIPQCAPCRGSLTTGRYFWNCGKKAFLQPASWQGYQDPFLSLPRFGESLAERGYFVARTGRQGRSSEEWEGLCRRVTTRIDMATQLIEASDSSCTLT